MKSISSKSFVVSLVLCVLLGLFGCEKKAPQSNQKTKAKIAIVTWVGYGPFFVAKEKGFFDKYGLDIDVVKIEELGARHSALISGAVQFSISTLDTFANEAAQGLPAVCIVKLSDSYGADGIVAKKEIQSIKDLKGKTIAFEKANPSHFFLIYLLEKEGLSIKDINPKYMTAGDAGAAFVAGKVDAAVTWEPWLSTANESENGHILVTSKEKLGLLLDVLTVHKDYAKSNPDVVNGVLKGWFDAVSYWKKNPVEANEIMAKGLGLSVQDFIAMLEGDRFSDYEENRKYFGLDSSEESPCFTVFKGAQKIWFQDGLIEKQTNPQDVIDISFLENLYTEQ